MTVPLTFRETGTLSSFSLIIIKKGISFIGVFCGLFYSLMLLQLFETLRIFC